MSCRSPCPELHQRARHSCRRARRSSKSPWTVVAACAATNAARTVTAALRTDNSIGASRSAPTWLYRLGDSPARGTANEGCVLGECAGLSIRPGRFPGRAAPAQLCRRKLDADFAPDGIDEDAISAAQQTDRAALSGFRGDMT